MAPKFTRSLEYSARCSQPEKHAAANEKSADIEEGVPAKRGFDGVPTGTLTVFPGCARLLIGFADQLSDEAEA